MKIVTAKEVADFLRLTESTVYNLAVNGKLAAFRIGNSWRFDMDQILQQIRESETQSKQKAVGNRKSAPRGIKKVKKPNPDKRDK